MTSRFTLLPVLGLLTPLALATAAGPVAPLQATARVERTHVQLGEPIRILVQVKNSEEKPEIEPPTVPGVHIGPAGSAQTVPSVLANVRPLPTTGAVPGQKLVQSLRALAQQLASDPNLAQAGADPQMVQQYQAALNGSLGKLNRDDYTVVYLADADKTGVLTLPAFTVRSGGQTVQTEPIKLTVTEPRSQPWVKAVLSVSNPKPLVGDEVNLYADLLVRRGPVKVGATVFEAYPIWNVTISVPTLDGIAGVEPVVPLEEVVRRRTLPPGKPGFRINTSPGMTLLEPEPKPGPVNTNDPQFYRRRLTFPIRALRAGEVTIPPVRAGGEVFVPSGSNGSYLREGFATVSPPLTLTIRDIPNRPADYNGTVGRCRLLARASLKEMTAGTPFVLTLREEGQSTLNRVSAPDLAAQPAFADHFVLRHDRDVLVSDTVREFVYTLRPRSAAVTEVPAVSLSYFDPRTEKFERVRSEPIPLRVKAGSVVAAPPATAPPAQAAKVSDIPAEDEQAPLVERPFPVGAAIWGMLCLGIVAVGVGLRVRLRRRRRQTIHRQQRQTVEQVRQRLHAPRITAAEVSAALQDFLRARFAMPPGEITPDEAAQRLLSDGYPSDLANGCADVLSQCAAAQFAPGLAPFDAELVSAADRLMNAILSARPRRPVPMAMPVDDLASQRAAALAD